MQDQNRFAFQIACSLLFAFGVGFLVLILVGQNAVMQVDREAQARQERLLSMSLAETIADIPYEQRSSTIWDEAVRYTRARDEEWMNSNLGTWMQEYFGHNESYVLDSQNQPYFAAVTGEVREPVVFDTRADAVLPLVARLRATMAKASRGRADPYLELADVGLVTPIRSGGETIVVSLVPIISDTGQTSQIPGTESIHVAVRYLDAAFARVVGHTVDLQQVGFSRSNAPKGMASVPVTGASGELLAELIWKPLQPGSDFMRTILPVLLIVCVLSGLVLRWIILHLQRVARKLQESETQAQQDLAELIRAREAAKVADQAKVNFISVVSHELRTPLTVILGYARLGKNLRTMPVAQGFGAKLRAEPVDLDRIEKSFDQLLQVSETGMEKIERSGEHLLFLVNQLLDYAKMETGKFELEPEVCNVKDVLDPVIDQMKVLTDQKGLVLKTKIEPCLMMADVLRTRQIIINLMGNAIKFTDEGAISLIVTADGDKVRIRVRDTGTGIEAHELENIFEAFHQADLSQSRSAAGTGLGLSVARELARLEGGTIEVCSKPGVGSTFTLTLPKAEAPLAIDKAA